MKTDAATLVSHSLIFSHAKSQNETIFAETNGINITCPNVTPQLHLYRVLRPDEDTKIGLGAKDPLGNKSQDSHVACNSRDGFKSQFLSFTTSLQIAQMYYNISQSKGLKPRIGMVAVSVSTLKTDKIKIFDFTNTGNRTMFLHNDENRKYSADACEVLLSLGSKTIPFTIIKSENV